MPIYYVADCGGKSAAHVRTGEKPPAAGKRADACATSPANGAA